MMETVAPARRGRRHHRRSTSRSPCGAWNAALAFVCGDPVVWKPSEKTPLTALAVQAIVRARRGALRRRARPGLSQVLIGGARARRGAGRRPAACRSSRPPARPAWAARSARAWPPRFGRALLELGGNNAAIVAPSADLDLALRGDRLRRHGHGRPALHDAAAAVRARERLRRARAAAEARLRPASPIGDPLERRHAGRPADRRGGLRGHAAALDAAAGSGRHGARRRARSRPAWPRHTTSRPALVEMPAQDGRWCDETFAPILYVMRYRRPRRGDRAAQRRAAGPVVVDLHHSTARGRDVPVGARLRLRHRQRQHRHLGRRDRRRVRRREGDRRRPRSRAPTPGRPTCAGRPTRSTSARPCRWRRASSSR